MFEVQEALESQKQDFARKVGVLQLQSALLPGCCSFGAWTAQTHLLWS
jgi:hypothetical protein